MSNTPVKSRSTLRVTLEREYAVDVASLRSDFTVELSEDGAITDEDVLRVCWENGVREPYFELQHEDEDCFEVSW